MKNTMPSFQMAHSVAGSGRPLLLIHGYPLNRQLWRAQAEALQELCTVITPDLRGHGESEAIPGPYTVDMLADDCANLLDHLQIRQPVILGGVSMGGYVAMAFCRRHPERLAGLLLIGTRAGADTPAARENREKAIRLAHEAGAGAIADSMLPKMFAPLTYTQRPELVAPLREMMAGTSVEGIVGALAAMKERPDSTSTLAEFSKPALVLHGAYDQLIPPQDAQAMHAVLPRSQFMLLPAAGHLPHLEQPEAFNTVLRQFIQSLP